MGETPMVRGRRRDGSRTEDDYGRRLRWTRRRGELGGGEYRTDEQGLTKAEGEEPWARRTWYGGGGGAGAGRKTITEDDYGDDCGGRGGGEYRTDEQGLTKAEGEEPWARRTWYVGGGGTGAGWKTIAVDEEEEGNIEQMNKD